MALRLVRAGTPLAVWNRTAGRAGPLREPGAEVAAGPGEVLARRDTVLLMLRDGDAADVVLGRGSAGLAVKDRTIVHMGTTSPGWSRALGEDVEKAGGTYAKLVERDFDVQASIRDVAYDSRLITEAARTASPPMDACSALFQQTLGLGPGSADMAAVVRALEARTVGG